MTVSATPRRAGPYAGNGVTTLFPFNFKVFTADDLQVVYTDADGVAATLVLNSDYSVLLNPDQDANPGGTITYPLFVGPTPILPVGTTLTSIGDLPYSQPTDITNTGRFLPQVFENALDRLTIQVQQLAEVAGRTLQAAIGTTVSLIFPAPSAGKFIRWRSDLLGLENAEAGTDSMVLQGLLADSTVNTRGAGMVGFGTGLTYPPGTAGVYLRTVYDMTSQTDATKGAALMGYLPPWTGAVGAMMADAMNERVSAARFGLKTTNTGAQNNTAMAAAVAFAVAQGGLTLHIPRGIYNFATTVDLAGANNLTISGDGIDATVLQINHATADFISCGSTIYQTITGLTITSSVTRTAGAMVKTGYWRRGMLFRVKVSKHFDGINLFQFEHCTLMETNIVTPTGAGTALIAGNPAATNQGANLSLVTMLIRGNDENTPESPIVTGARGMLLYDVQAVYGFNVDLSAFLNEVMVVDPTTATENCFFTSCYFDITVGGDNILVQGAGHKNRFKFSNCWFGGAGRFGAGAADKYGIRFADVGTYTSWLFDGCEFLGTSGPGVGSFTAQSEFIFTGCIFNNCGLDTTLNTAVYVSLGSAQTKFMQFTGCKFIPSTVAFDFLFTLNAQGNIITGCELLRGVSYQGGAQFGYVSGNSDPNTSDSVASAATLQIPVTKTNLFVTGTTNVGGLFRTFTGHRVDFTATSAFTWQNGGALALKGAANFVAAAGNVLTLVCRADGTWQEVSRSA